MLGIVVDAGAGIGADAGNGAGIGALETSAALVAFIT